MDETKGTIDRARRTSRRWITSVALVGAGVITGGVLAGSQLAQAQDSSSGGAASGSAVSALRDPADLLHGPGEELLSGSQAKEIERAALDEVPGGTIIRVETDSDGAAYEAHVRTADGSEVTVKFDSDGNATETIDGFGGPAPGTMPSDDASNA